MAQSYSKPQFQENAAYVPEPDDGQTRSNFPTPPSDKKTNATVSF